MPTSIPPAPHSAPPESAAPGHEPLKGAFYIILAVASMAGIDLCAKLLVDDYPIHQVILFRGVFAVLPAAALIAMSGGWRTARITYWPPHFVRAALSIGAMVTFFLALRYMTLADATAVAMSAPLFIVLFAVVILGERPGPRRWAAVAAGFIGVIVMLRPSPDGLAEPAAVLAITAAACYALLQVVTRKYAATETTQAYTLSATVLIALAAGLYALFQDWTTPQWADAPAIVGIGVCGGVANIFMIMAYRAAEASFVSSMDYTVLIWAVFFGWVFFNELPDPVTMAGAAFVIAAGLYVIQRETSEAKRARARARAQEHS
ncbi:MAG: DMT family transporter [Rhodospirillales bacterium]